MILDRKNMEIKNRAMHINVIILYYGSYVLESNRVFSMPGDIGFVILFTLPMLLTLKDCVRRKK